MSVDSARIKAVGRSVIMTLMKSNTEHAVHKFHTCSYLTVRPSSPPSSCLLASSLSISARLHGAHGPHPLYSALPTPRLLFGCTFRFNFVAIMHAKVQCFVGLCPSPCSWVFYCVFHRSTSSVSLTPSLPFTQQQRQLK